MKTGHQQCLLCGENNPHSLGLTFQCLEDGRVTARFKGRPNLQGYNGILHGGVTSALLDAAMTHCLFHRKVTAVTAELNVRYLHEIPYSSELELSAWLEKEKRGLYMLQGEIRIAEQVVAKSWGKFIKRAEKL